MSVHNLNLFPKNDITEDGKEGENSGKSTFSINDQKRNVINFESIGEVPDACTALVSMGDDHHLMATVNEFGGQLVDMTFDSSRLWKEEVADHGDVVRHLFRSIKWLFGNRL